MLAPQWFTLLSEWLAQLQQYSVLLTVATGRFSVTAAETLLAPLPVHVPTLEY